MGQELQGPEGWKHKNNPACRFLGRTMLAAKLDVDPSTIDYDTMCEIGRAVHEDFQAPSKFWYYASVKAIPYATKNIYFDKDYTTAVLHAPNQQTQHPDNVLTFLNAIGAGTNPFVLAQQWRS